MPTLDCTFSVEFSWSYRFHFSLATEGVSVGDRIAGSPLLRLRGDLCLHVLNLLALFAAWELG